VEQAHLVLVIVAPDGVHHAATAQGADDHELQEGKAAAGPLEFWLGIELLVFLGVGQGQRGAVDDFDGTALQEPGGTDPLVGGPRGVGQRGLEQIQRQPRAGLAVAAVASSSGGPPDKTSSACSWRTTSRQEACSLSICQTKHQKVRCNE